MYCCKRVRLITSGIVFTILLISTVVYIIYDSQNQYNQEQEDIYDTTKTISLFYKHTIIDNKPITYTNFKTSLRELRDTNTLDNYFTIRLKNLLIKKSR